MTWGTWYNLISILENSFHVTISAEQISNAKGSFTGRVRYFSDRGWVEEDFIGPGSYSFTTAHDGGLHQIQAKFKGHATGMPIRLIVSARLNTAQQNGNSTQMAWPQIQ